MLALILAGIVSTRNVASYKQKVFYSCCVLVIFKLNVASYFTVNAGQSRLPASDEILEIHLMKVASRINLF